MALYMPTNITPSTLGALGSGTVDATKDMTVSWQVDGQNAMTAFEIEIYRNVAESTEIYSTGKKTDGCPFYGRDAKGNVVFFSYVITAAELAGAGITNGGSYKLRITQWWTEEDSITQQSASVFICRSAPVLTINDFSLPISKRSFTFSATYQQAQGDPITWVRWMLETKENLADEFQRLEDTGNVQTAQLEFSYDGFFNDRFYRLRCMVETSNGVVADTGWTQPFLTWYEPSAYQGAVSVCAKRAQSGVLVSWPGAYSIPGVVSGAGTYTVEDSVLSMPYGGNTAITWDAVSGKPMEMNAETYVWKGKYTISPQPLFIVQTKSDDGTETVEATLSLGNDYIRIENPWGGQAIRYISLENLERPLKAGDDVVVTITGFDMTVYTSASTKRFYHGYDFSFARFVVHPIEKIVMENPTVCDFLWVLSTKESPDVEEIAAGQLRPEFTESTVFLADFDDGLGAGNVDGNAGFSSWSIYRAGPRGESFDKVATLPFSHRSVIDCAAVSEGSYAYYVFGDMEDGTAAAPLVSTPISPCLWDWTILSCVEEAENVFSVQEIFRFSLNVSSGSVKNGNRPGLLENFTRYPTVQASPSNYQNGTLSGYLGHVGENHAYVDSIGERDALFALSTTGNALFLKDRKGDLLRIAISGEITAQTQDATRQQALICSVPWVETGAAGDAQIFIREGSPLYDNAGGSGGGESDSDRWLQQVKVVQSSFDTFTVLPDAGYAGIRQVRVNAMPYKRTKNAQGGISVVIGGE